MSGSPSCADADDTCPALLWAHVQRRERALSHRAIGASTQRIDDDAVTTRYAAVAADSAATDDDDAYACARTAVARVAPAPLLHAPVLLPRRHRVDEPRPVVRRLRPVAHAAAIRVDVRRDEPREISEEIPVEFDLPAPSEFAPGASAHWQVPAWTVRGHDAPAHDAPAARALATTAALPRSGRTRPAHAWAVWVAWLALAGVVGALLGEQIAGAIAPMQAQSVARGG